MHATLKKPPQAQSAANDPPVPVGMLGRLAAWKIGPLPAPVYLAIAAITVAAALSKRLPNDMIGGFAVLMLAGFLLGEIGGKLPVFKHIGGAAILCLFLPSAMVGYKVMDPEMLKAITTIGNDGSLAFHKASGWNVTLVEDYAGPARPRIPPSSRPPPRRRPSEARGPASSWSTTTPTCAST